MRDRSVPSLETRETLVLSLCALRECGFRMRAQPHRKSVPIEYRYVYSEFASEQRGKLEHREFVTTTTVHGILCHRDIDRNNMRSTRYSRLGIFAIPLK